MNPELCVIAVPLREPDGQRRHGWFSIYADAEDRLFSLPLGISRDPLADAAHYFLRAGVDPGTPIAIRHDFGGPYVGQSTLLQATRGALFGGNVADLAKFRSLKAVRKLWVQKLLGG